MKLADLLIFDYDEDFELKPHVGSGATDDEFKKLYGVTPAQYRIQLGFNDTVDAWIEEEYESSKNDQGQELKPQVSKGSVSI